jgi:hypothetical protein
VVQEGKELKTRNGERNNQGLTDYKPPNQQKSDNLGPKWELRVGLCWRKGALDQIESERRAAWPGSKSFEV